MFTDRLTDGFYKDIWNDTPYKDPKQLEMEFLWPHNGIQLGLDLDRPEQPKDKSPFVVSNGITGVTFAGANPLWGTTTINSSQLEINIANAVGDLKIGGMSVGLKTKPKWYQKVLYKLLGFNWKDYNG
jgi:hypothetical protein